MVLRSNGTRSPAVEIRVDGVRIREVKIFKYLGFLISPDLSLTAHVTRATERARAASSAITRILRRIQIRNLRRLGVYLASYVESQFYCSELLATNVVDSWNSARSHFVRSFFDLPLTTLHKLAVILHDVPPVEVTLLQRRHNFLKSISNHDFSFVRDACDIDRECLLSLPKSWHHGLVRLIRSYDPDFSTVDFDPACALDSILSSFGDRRLLNFYFIKNGDSESLSFFRLPPTLQCLDSFRSLLESLSFDHSRLVILFCSSLLRFRFCHRPLAACPLCRKAWLWEHFLSCPRLRLLPSAPSVATLPQFRVAVLNADWKLLLSYIRFILIEWSNVLPDVSFPFHVIDTLSLD
jgi:hypothetical protein